MLCPNCNADKVRRSQRQGVYEGLLLRLTRRAPYRCRNCRLRFIASTAAGGRPVGRRRSLAAYLGLRGSAGSPLALSIGALLLVLLATGTLVAFFILMSD